MVRNTYRVANAQIPSAGHSQIPTPPPIDEEDFVMTEKNSTKEEKKKSPEKEEKINLEDEKPAPVLVAPDGGWGWFIVLSYILMGVSNIFKFPF